MDAPERTAAPIVRMPENAIQPVRPPLGRGDPFPWFRIASDVNPDFQFSSLAGRTVVFAAVGSVSREPMAGIARALLAQTKAFDGRRAALVLLTADPADIAARPKLPPGAARIFYDETGAVSQLIGVMAPDRPGAITPATFILDERLRVADALPLVDPATHAADVIAALLRRPAPEAPRAAVPQAPVLMVPDVFEPEFCRRLIEGYEAHGGQESGYMQEKDGKTVLVVDYNHKRRTDWVVEDERLQAEVRGRILRRLVPEIRKATQFQVTRMERYLVACYDAAVEGHFNAHRDNTTKGTAHRRFAVSINLNPGDYEGGDLVFAEYGQARYRPPLGGACVFSCSLLHEATRVTRGKRYCFLPFLYDDAAAEIRDANRGFVAMG